MPGGVPKLPKIQPADIQAAVGWGVAAAAGAIWVVQIFRRIPLGHELLYLMFPSFMLKAFSFRLLVTDSDNAVYMYFGVVKSLISPLSSPDFIFFCILTSNLFAATCMIKPVPSDESSQISISQQDVEGEIDSSDDGMPPMEANTNRLRLLNINGSECSPLLLILHQCRSQISVAYSDTRQKRVFGDTRWCCS
ncbi:unnamed protein product, partial [Brassica rapa subsp. narinosa]